MTLTRRLTVALAIGPLSFGLGGCTPFWAIDNPTPVPCGDTAPSCAPPPVITDAAPPTDTPAPGAEAPPAR